MNPLEAIQKYLAEVKAVRVGLPPRPWRYDSGNVQVEATESRLPVCNIATTNDLSGDDYGSSLPWSWNAAGDFIAQSPVTQEKLERALAIAVEALRGLRQPGHAAELRMDKIMADIARAIGEEK